MVQLECSRTAITNLTAFESNFSCEQNLEVALYIHAITLGFSIAVSSLCLYHLYMKFKMHLAHFVIMGFSLLLLAGNILAFILLSQSFHTYLHFLFASASSTSGNISFPGPSVSVLSQQITQRAYVQDLFLPVFLWVTDAFLLYRAWVIWYGRRLALIFPYGIWFISLVSGIVCLALFSKTKFLETPWIPALSFSSAVDVVTTSMIAGRLYFHHRRQQRMGLTGSKFFISALAICVESGLMSTVSKLAQFAIPISDRALTVVPLVCIASNLIILRKALGTDVSHAITEGQLSEMQFGSVRGQVGSGRSLDSVSGGVELESKTYSTRVGFGRNPQGTQGTVSIQSLGESGGAD